MSKTNNTPSDFFTIAPIVDALSTKKITVSRFESNIKNALPYASVIGATSPAIQLTSTIGLSNAQVVVLSTAEAEAVGGAGLFTRDTHGAYQFCLPRFHLGPLAQLDMSVAVSQLAMTDLMKSIIDDSTSDNSGIIQFTREGHLTSWQIAVWLASEKNIPTTLVKISHQPAINQFTRIAHIDGDPNLEGFPKKLKRLYICDPIASGMQHVTMIEYLEKIQALPEEIVVIAPMATLFGLQVIAMACQQRGIQFKAGVLGALLDSTTPLRYFSPYPQSQDQVANVQLHQYIRSQFDSVIHSWCIRCNWTASFMGGVILPNTASDEELMSLGLDRATLDSLQLKIQYNDTKLIGLDNYLLPFSSLLCEKSPKY